ncbi:uncharacterized protein GGS22DRAFT_38276 [Annulohypoxylon maeteangense]|uniref:uncharacterized protein n=1 Tax=Annulohypoxylon maeteangense TaxID=1927788 RepID=UPI0020087434|nr:uncharacterized protein GGS22DRAFT_38276 [Annulohypoxylon maeteangense]KAI0883286.1 hypothetical protein GGS22DRAFT_38276 [Annulohypoxylon maeteangense]
MAGDDAAYYMRPGHVVAAAIALSVVDIVAVTLRFWARKVQRQPPKADDWLMIPATVLTVGIGIAEVYGVSKRGLAYRIEVPEGYTGKTSDLVTPQLALKAQIEWAYLLMLPLALGCTKASFLFFYMRVFAIQKRSVVNKILRVSIAFTAAWMIAFFFATLFECNHNFWRIWNSETEFLTRCSYTVNLVLILCITDFVTDIFILFIPVPLVLRLNLSKPKKISVCLMFFLGGVTVIVSLIRFIMMAGSFIGNFDMTDDNILGVTACLYWGMVESGVGVFAACLPTIQFLFRKFIWEPALSSSKSLFSSRSSRTAGSRDAIHVDQTFGVTYDKLHNISSRGTSPSYLTHAPSNQVSRHSYVSCDDRLRTAI